MRQATIVIQWEGPDKRVREFIDDHLDRLFEGLTEAVPDLVFATSSIAFRSRLRPPGGGA